MQRLLMPLSISNSKNISESNVENNSRKAALFFGVKVAFLVLLFFVGLEFFTRTKLFGMSKDFARFASYPERAKTLTQSPGFKIAFVGNSATERGIDLDTFNRNFAVQSPQTNLRTDLFVADASKINTWHYLLNTYFWKPELKPDLTIITYYQRNLEDGSNFEIGRLAQFFTTKDDWSDVLRHDLPNNGDRIEFVVSSGWATFASRARTKERVLSLFTPQYKEFVQTVSNMNEEHSKYLSLNTQHLTLNTSLPLNAHFALRRLLASAKTHGMRLCFVAYPTRPESGKSVGYDLDKEEVKLIESAGMMFLDMREGGAQPVDHYADEIHLTPDGAKDYSEKFAAQLAKRLQVFTLHKSTF